MKIMFAADMSFNYYDEFKGKEHAYKTMSEIAALFRQADYSMINLENVLGNKEDGYPIIKSGPNLISEDCFIEYIHALKPNIVGLANNHTKDYGEDIMYHTMKMLSESGYTYIGAGRNIEEAYRPALLSKNGIDVAIIAVCENEFGTASEDVSGTAGYRLGRVTKAIREAAKMGMKPVIYFHGGNETYPFPSPCKVELYRHFIDIGAEAVIAMHTHCPQGYEYYNDKPIVYSMGNFFFPKQVSGRKKSWFYGYISELEFEANGVQLHIYPYKFDLDSVTLLRGTEKDEFMKYMECLCRPIKNEKEIQELFDSWCSVSCYMKGLAEYNVEFFTDGFTEEIKGIKNILGCEAHNELVKNAFLMIFESRVEEAKKGIERIRMLQDMEYTSCYENEGSV